MKKLFIFISLWGFCALSAQEYISMRPNWTFNTPQAEDPTYEYYVSKGVGNTEKEARKDAFVLAAKEAQARNMAIEMNSGEIMSVFQNSDEDFNVIARNCRIPMREVCQFTEKSRDGKYYYYQLLQLAQRSNLTPNFKPYSGDCYDFSKAHELRELFQEEYKERAEAEKKAAKEAAKQERSEKWAESRDSWVAWTIGTGYPWSLYASVEYRGGYSVGWGIYGDIGMDYTSISVDGGSYNTGHVTKTFFKYAAGVRFYPYKGLFIDCGYGSIAKPTDKVSYDFHWQDAGSGIIDKDDRVHIRERAVGNSHGILFHVGYNFVIHGDLGFLIGVNGGASYDIVNKVFAPSVNLKFGFAVDL